MMKKTFVKDGRTFSCIATEENVKHLTMSGWVPVAEKPEVKPVEKEQEKPIIEAPAPKRGRPLKAFSRE